MLERTQILDLMGELKLYGMRTAYDEVMATAIARQLHAPCLDRRQCDGKSHSRGPVLRMRDEGNRVAP